MRVPRRTTWGFTLLWLAGLAGLLGLGACQAYRPVRPDDIKAPTVKVHPFRSGTPRWVFPSDKDKNKIKMERIVSTPKLGTGVVIITTLDEKVYAIDYNGKLKWQFKTSGVVTSSPATGVDGTVYVGTRDKQFLHAIGSDGKQKWRKLINGRGRITASPYVDSSYTVSKKEVIYVASGFELHAIVETVRNGKKRGKLLWRYESERGRFSRSSPAVDDSGIIYIASEEGVLHAIDPRAKPDGDLLIKPKWIAEVCTKSRITASPTVDAVTNRIYVGCWNGELHAISSRGKILSGSANTKQRAFLKTKGPILATPVLSADGKKLYIGSDDGKFYAVHPKTGASQWTFLSGEYKTGKKGKLIVGKDGKLIRAKDSEAYFQAKACLGQTGNVYVGSVNQLLYALNPVGKLLWQFDVGGRVTNAPIRKTLGRGRDVIFVAAGRRLYAINP